MRKCFSFKGICGCGSLVKSFGCVGLFTDADANGACGFIQGCVWGGVFVLIRMRKCLSIKGMCGCGSLLKSCGCVGLFTDVDAQRMWVSFFRVCVCVGLFADVDPKRESGSL